MSAALPASEISIPPDDMYETRKSKSETRKADAEELSAPFATRDASSFLPPCCGSCARPRLSRRTNVLRQHHQTFAPDAIERRPPSSPRQSTPRLRRCPRPPAPCPARPSPPSPKPPHPS